MKGENMPENKNKRPRALIISADNFEDSELLVPYYRLKEAEVEVDVASMRRGKIKGKHGYEVEVNRELDDIDPKDYGILIIPGGKAPEKLRREGAAIEIVKSFFLKRKPVAAICHGPLLLVTAGVLKGRRATCYKSISAELEEAGAFYQDKAVVVDENLITSRQPSDLPKFLREIMKKI